MNAMFVCKLGTSSRKMMQTLWSWYLIKLRKA